MVDGKEASINKVQFLKTDPKARFQGYSFYFREGLCWSDINTTFLKCRKKQKSINDVKSMSFFGLTLKVPESYIISLINSTFLSVYVNDFINNTQTFQINDARQLPIIVPSSKQLLDIDDLFYKAIQIKIQETNSDLSDNENSINLKLLQTKLDKLVLEIYGL
jgi:hypothetical protein